MYDGFIPGSRGSFIIDSLTVLMLIILALQGWSLVSVRLHKRYHLHKRIQLSLAGALGLTLALFETHIRLYGWTHRAEASPYYTSLVFPALYFHLLWACLCVILWIVVVWQALKYFPKDLSQARPFAATHRRLARPAVAALVATTLSGWLFFWLAFMAH